MKKEITLSQEELENMIKKTYKIKGDITVYFQGGVINPLSIKVVYHDKMKK